MKYLQESGLRVPLSSQVSPPSQSPLEARGEALLRPGGGRGGPGLGGHGGVQAEDGGVRGAGGEEEEEAPPLDVNKYKVYEVQRSGLKGDVREEMRGARRVSAHIFLFS